MFTSSSFFSLAAGLASLYLAMPAVSLSALTRRDLPPGLPRDCYCNYTGCQYGIISQPYNISKSVIVDAEGNNLGNTASPGDSLVYAWDPLPCYPNNTLAIGVRSLSGPDPTSVYNPDGVFYGPVLTNLGGRNESANGTYVFNGIGLVPGQIYQAALMTYNTTTGLPDIISGIDFSWQTPYPY